MARVPQQPPAYRRAIVTFIDILGFRDLVATRDAATIAGILSDLGYFTEGEESDSIPTAGAARSVQFSDSVVRVCPVDTEDQTDALFFELHTLATAQYALACQGILLRGGVTLGEVYINGATVFGPALIRAYDLESRQACNPRILVDPALVAAHAASPGLQGDAHDLQQDLSFIDQLLATDTDGQIFVDYLSEMVATETSAAPFDRLHGHITAALHSGLPDPVHRKYLWLADYFNRMVAARTAGAVIPLHQGPPLP